MRDALEASVEGGWITILGGDPRGGDPLHRSISKIAGWRRSRKQGSLASGEPCSVFMAPLYPHTAVPAIRLISHHDADILTQDFRQIRLVADSIDRAKETLESPPTGLLFSPPGERKLFPHQLQAVEAARLMGYKCMIGDDMGLGKTTTALTAFHQSKADRLLVVCPASVKFNWEREARAVLGEDVMVHVIDGTPKKREKILGDMAECSDEGGLAVINYDLLPHLKDDHAFSIEAWSNGQMVVLDESHYIKSRDAKRTEWVLRHLADPSYRMCLSGTPVRNRIDDLYTQAEWMRPGCWTSYSDFCRRYLVQVKITIGSRSFFEPKGTKNHAELNKIINTFQIRRKKEEAFDLPPKVRTHTELELDKRSRKIYEQMKTFALLDLAELDDDTPMFQPKAGSALNAILRCEQIAQGFVGGIPEEYLKQVLPLLDGHAERVAGRKELVFPNGSKIKDCREFIDDVLAQGGQPVVIGNYNGPLFWLHDQYEGSSIIHGQLSSKRRQEEIDEFQAGRSKVMFMQVKCAIGFDLTASNDVYFLGWDESPSVNDQAEDRCHRIGTKGTVNIRIPVVQRTIETTIHARVGQKADEAELAIRNMTVGQLREIL